MRPAPLSFEQTRDAIATDLETFAPEAPVSVARLVGDLHLTIQGCLDRGVTFPEVARIFERHGVRANPDAVRVAMTRHAPTSLKRPLRKTVSKRTTEAAPNPLEAEGPDFLMVPRTEDAIAQLSDRPEPPSQAPVDVASSEPPFANRTPVIGKRLE